MSNQENAHNQLAATIHMVLTRKIPGAPIDIRASIANHAAREIEERFEVKLKEVLSGTH